MRRIFLLATVALVGCAEQTHRPSQGNVAATVRARPAAQASASAAPEALHTTVSGHNVEDITRDVQGWHDMQHADCQFVRVLGAEVVSQDTKSVTEHWTIEACKRQTFTYKVFIIPGTGAITDAVSNLDGSPIGSGKP